MYSVAVLGSSGMIGHEVSRQLITESRLNVYRYQRKVNTEDKSIFHFDIYEQDIKTIATEFSAYDYVVNCTGVIKHLIDPFDQSSFQKIKEVNTSFPKLLSTALQNSGTRIIEIGTDCVFSGTTGNYSEDSVKDAIDLYGESKRLGEIEANNVMRIRTSVIGLEKERSKELLSWFLSKRNESVDGYTNHCWNGITSYHLGLLIKTIIEKNMANLLQDLEGKLEQSSNIETSITNHLKYYFNFKRDTSYEKRLHQELLLFFKEKKGNKNYRN